MKKFEILPPVSDDINSKTLELIVDEFVKTEIYYVNERLRLINDFFYLPLLQRSKVGHFFITEQDVNTLFINFGMIYELHRDILADILSVQSSMIARNVCQEEFSSFLITMLAKKMPYMKAYIVFLSGYDAITGHFKRLCHGNREFEEFIDIAELCATLDFEDLLGALEKRIRQNLVYFRLFVEKGRDTSLASQSDTKFETLSKALDSLEEDLRKGPKEAKRRRDVFKIQEYFGGTEVLVSPSRYLIKFGKLVKVHNHQSTFTDKFVNVKSMKKVLYSFALFNDILVYGVGTNASNAGRVHRILSISRLSARNVLDGTMLNLENGFRVNSPEKSFVVIAKSESEKKDWIDAINSAADGFKSNAEQKKRYMTLSGSKTLALGIKSTGRSLKNVFEKPAMENVIEENEFGDLTFELPRGSLCLSDQESKGNVEDGKFDDMN